MKSGRYVIVLILSLSLYPAKSQTTPVFNAQNFPGTWTLATNADGTIDARETAVHRQGTEAYSRILHLKAVEVQIPAPDPGAATEAEVRRFIAEYRPPEIPYTSERSAKDTGREKFTCLEFAEDLVQKAKANDIPAQVIGVLFEGKMVGHAIAGFPTAEGQTLYFDSTPGAGQISHKADEAQVQVGQPYSRTGGGELAEVGQLPITTIIPVTKLEEFADSVGASVPSGRTDLVVENEKRVQGYFVEYADTNSLQVADDQLAKWRAAADDYLAAQRQERDKRDYALQSVAAKAAALALAENEEQAASNDAYGQLRMGERYLKGDGVKRDPVLGRAYLKQAADQDNPTARRELERIAQ
jgi:TPR repeat protein